MTENYIKPEHVSSEVAQKILNFLNSARSSEEIASTVEIPQERDVGLIVDFFQDLFFEKGFAMR